MAQDREKIFRLIETADNSVEYAAPGKEARAEARSRKRYLIAGRRADMTESR